MAKPKPKVKGELFQWMDALYTKERKRGTPPMFMINRFLVSDKSLASAVASIQIEMLRAGAHVQFFVWQGLLPKGQAAPQFSYPAPKKREAAEQLTERMIESLGEPRRRVEEMQEIVQLAGREDDLYREFGIEHPDDKPTPTPKAKPPPQSGLLQWAKS